MTQFFTTTGFVVNPASGGCAGGRMADRLRAAGARVLVTDPRGFREDFIVFSQGIERIVVVGGDGAFSMVARAILVEGLDVAVGLMPFGTGNDMARALGTNRVFTRGETASLPGFFGGLRERVIDIWRIADAYFANYLSFGIDALIAREFDAARKLGRINGPQLLNKIAYASLFLRRFRSSLSGTARIVATDADGRRTELAVKGRFKTILFMNIPSYGGGARHPCVDPSDGLIDIYVVKRSYPFVRLLGARGLPGLASLMKARSVRLRIDGDVPAQFDGETIENLSGELELTHAGKLRVLGA